MDLLTINDKDGEYPPSFYAATAEIPQVRSSVAGDLTCDVCVVGGGFSGVSAALHLAQRGYDVVLLEAQRIGFGASGRNGGQVGSGQRRDQDDLEEMVGRDHAKKLWDISRQAQNLVRDLCRDPEIDTPFHDGIIHAAHQPKHVRPEQDYARKLTEQYGHQNIRPLDREALRELVKSDMYHGGTLDLDAGHVHPLRLVLGMARKAENEGVRIFERSRVTDLAIGPTHKVSTNQGTVSAKFLVLACNGYLGDLDRKVAAHVMPINSYVVATEPLDHGAQERLISNNYAVADTKFVINYFRFSEDHRLIFGGTESYGYKFPPDIAADVRKPMTAVFPQLADTRIDYAWGGTLGITLNRMPDFRRLAGNALSISGYSGHGVAMATLGGQIAAETIAGQAERFDIMANVPRRAFPGGSALRSPLLFLAMTWYALRDRM